MGLVLPERLACRLRQQKGVSVFYFAPLSVLPRSPRHVVHLNNFPPANLLRWAGRRLKEGEYMEARRTKGERKNWRAHSDLADLMSDVINVI